MSRLRTVDVYPDGGGERWCVEPDDDAFARTAQRVAAAYSEALPTLDLPIKKTHLRVFVGEHRARIIEPGAAATVEFTWFAKHEGFHSTTVRVPPGVAELSPTARALLVLDVIEIATTMLGEHAGWDPALLAPARAHVLVAGLEFTYTSPWKNSPGRRHKARVAARIDEDGWGRVRAEVTDGATILASREFATGNGVGFLRGHAENLRWTGPETLGLDFGLGLTEHVALADLTPGRDSADPIDPDTPRPAVVRLVPEPDPWNRLVVHGGGDMAFEPVRYAVALVQTLDQLKTPAWDSWWASAGLGPLHVGFWLGWGGQAPKYLVRKTRDTDDPEGRDKHVAEIRRPYGSVAADVDPASLARSDVATLMAAVRKRAGLGPHPDLTVVEEIDQEWAEGLSDPFQV